MPSSDSIDDDLQRAKAILARLDQSDHTPPTWLVDMDVRAAYQLLASFVAEIERLQAEHTRDVLRYTVKGYQAGEHTDATHWRVRAETAEAELARLRALVNAVGEDVCTVALRLQTRARHPPK